MSTVNLNLSPDMNLIEALPSEIAVLIFAKLKSQELATCSFVSSYWRYIADSDSCWKPRLKEMIDGPLPVSYNFKSLFLQINSRRVSTVQEIVERIEGFLNSIIVDKPKEMSKQNSATFRCCIPLSESLAEVDRPITSWFFYQQPFSTNISIQFIFKKAHQWQDRLESEDNTEIHIKPFNLKLGDLIIKGFNVENDYFYTGKNNGYYLESEIMNVRRMLPKKNHPNGTRTEDVPFHFSVNMGSSEKMRFFAPLVSKLVMQRQEELYWEYIERKNELKSKVEILAGLVATFVIVIFI